MSKLRAISDEEMTGLLATSQNFSVVVLKQGPRYQDENARSIIFEHGRRNLQLREAGLLRIVCPILDDTELCGIGIFTTDLEETGRLLQDDPAVKAGVLVHEVHPARGFPGDSLPR